jgi:hypothetical protein
LKSEARSGGTSKARPCARIQMIVGSKAHPIVIRQLVERGMKESGVVDSMSGPLMESFEDLMECGVVGGS